MQKYFSLLIFSCVLLISCNDDAIDENSNNKGGNTTSNISVVILDSISQYIADKVETDSLITFYGNTPDDLLPETGTIIFIPISEKTPSGFLGKILTIEKGNPIKVFTEFVPLEEVFQNLSIDTTLVDVLSHVENIVDENGNPIEFEIIDTLLTDTIDSLSDSRRTRAGGYLQGGVIKFPFKIADKEEGHTLNGLLYVDIKNFDFRIDAINNEITSINFRADPIIKVSLTDEIEIKGKKLGKSTLIGSINCMPITIPTPLFGLPLILRPKFYLYLIYGATGEITASVSLQYQTGFECEMHWENDQWDKKRFESKGFKNEQPWTVTEFDVSGEIYVGSKMGLLVGFYSATTGVGINITPKFSLEADAKLSTDNLLDINPEVELAAKWSGDLFFTASIFKRPIAHYSFSSPEYVAWSEKMYLLPQFDNFEAKATSSSGEINYQIDSHYFLSLFGVRAGARVYESDKKTIVGTYYPNPTKKDNEGVSYYTVNVENLNPQKTYYATPIASFLDFAWQSGNMYKLTMSEPQLISVVNNEISYRYTYDDKGNLETISFSDFSDGEDTWTASAKDNFKVVGKYNYTDDYDSNVGNYTITFETNNNLITSLSFYFYNKYKNFYYDDEEDSEDRGTMTFKYNTNGQLSVVTFSDTWLEKRGDNDTDKGAAEITMAFTYSADNRITSMKDVAISYYEGVQEAVVEDTYKFEYSSDNLNEFYQYTPALFYDIDMLGGLSAFACAGLFGKASAYLPTQCTISWVGNHGGEYTGSDTRTYSYSFNADGTISSADGYGYTYANADARSVIGAKIPVWQANESRDERKFSRYNLMRNIRERYQLHGTK